MYLYVHVGMHAHEHTHELKATVLVTFVSP